MSIGKVRSSLIDHETIHNKNRPSINDSATTRSTWSNTIKRKLSKIFPQEESIDTAFHSAIVDCISLTKLREKVHEQQDSRNRRSIKKHIRKVSSSFSGYFFRDLLKDLDAFFEKKSSLRSLRKSIAELVFLRDLMLDHLVRLPDHKNDPKEDPHSQSNTYICTQKRFMLDKLEKLAIGTSALFPYFAKKHTFCVEIYRNEHGHDIVVYNTGNGLVPFHSEATKIGSPRRGYYYPVMYRGVRKDQFPELVRNLLLMQLGKDIDAQPNSNGTHLHNKLIDPIQALHQFLRSISSQVCKEPPKDHPLLAYKEQSFGTCKFSCIRVWLRQAIFRQKDGAKIYREFNAFRLEKILQRISSATASKNGKERLSNETRDVISEIATSSLEKRRLKIHNPSWPQYAKRQGFFQKIFALIARIYLFLQHQRSRLILLITGKQQPQHVC